jgi:L-rhamnose mutarotase
LVGYFETPNLQAALDGMAATEVNARWQGEMKKYFVELDGRQPDEGFVQLERVMYWP